MLDRPLLGIVSSHKKLNGFASQGWQNALMSALSFAREQNAAILYSASTPYAEAIHNACVKTNSVSIRLGERKSYSDHRSDDGGSDSILVDSELDVSSPEMRCLPFLDRLVVAISNQVFVLDIDPAGKIAKLIDRRLNSAEFPTGSIFIAHHVCDKPSRQHRWFQSQLDRGAVAWLVRDTEQRIVRGHCQKTMQFCQVPIFPATMLASSGSSFLVHCTRARRGAWPDQSAAQFYDELFIQPWDSPPSTLQSLIRIVESQRLLATAYLKSGETSTISFTQRSLLELLTARNFEAHLARWDWEPYGIMISRKWLAAAGCRPVTYLKKDELKNLDREALPFTQPYDESMATDKKGRDWRVEQEWRLQNDLRLHQVPFSEAIVFVKYHWEAKLLATVSRWPVCYAET